MPDGKCGDPASFAIDERASFNKLHGNQNQIFNSTGLTFDAANAHSV